MNTKMALIAIFVSAVITFGLRALPFLVFQEGKELPDQIKRLGMVLPSSIMAVLIVYCLKDKMSGMTLWQMAYGNIIR